MYRSLPDRRRVAGLIAGELHHAALWSLAVTTKRDPISKSNVIDATEGGPQNRLVLLPVRRPMILSVRSVHAELRRGMRVRTLVPLNQSRSRRG